MTDVLFELSPSRLPNVRWLDVSALPLSGVVSSPPRAFLATHHAFATFVALHAALDAALEHLPS
jgi:hypothetical protein